MRAPSRGSIPPSVKRSLLLGTVLSVLAACGGEPAPPPVGAPGPAPLDPALFAELERVVDTYRRIIVLMTDEGTLPAKDRPRAFLAGKILFEQNRERLGKLEEAGRAEITAARESSFRHDLPLVTALLDRLEQESGWHDADRLAFRDLAASWSEGLGSPAPASPKGKALLLRLDEDRRALGEIQSLYEQEIEKVFAQFGTRGIPIKREAWEGYLAFLRSLTTAEAVFEALRPELPPPPPPLEAPAVVPAGKPLNGSSLPEKTLVLTFDDGPHATNTPKILEILARYGAQALFFAVGENLGHFGKDGVFVKSRGAGAIEAALTAGHLLANHTLSHAQLPKLDAAGITTEIDEMAHRAREFDPNGPRVFRPPYGAWDAEVAKQAAERELKMMLWNIDSQDWADPVASSIANRVVADARRLGRGVILFHDIHAQTVEALPLVLETLGSEGFRFALWDGETLSEPRGAPVPVAVPTPEPARALYGTSHAVVIGIDDYEHWPKLTYAVADALAVRELLVRRLGFSPENVHLLLDREASREHILEVLGDRMADPARVAEEDRLLVFYAGHGATRRLAGGRALGYIVPADADRDRLQAQAISMTQFADIDEAVPAKHVLYLMDACYGGMALLRGGAGGAPDSRNFLREATRRRARQMLTAGGADELVADGGPGGHSIFTWTLLQGLGGEADLNRDGFIAASELFAYTGPLVAQLSKQTPAFGSLAGSEGGEVVFALAPDEEFLTTDSSQLDQEAVALNQRLDEVRGAIAAKVERNQKLKQELALAERELARLSQSEAAVPLEVADRARAAHERGLALYRERRYEEALAPLLQAVELEPGSALYANNLGYLYYKRGDPEAALTWIRKAEALDPKRAMAFQNEGEILESLYRSEEAKAAYAKFLELAPSHASAPNVRRRLEKLGG